MGGGPSIPAPPPPPDPFEAAKANSLFYRSSMETYLEKSPDLAEMENKLRVKYMPEQRQLERDLQAGDQRAAVQTGLQLEREYGGQRTLEGLRRQYETSPAAFALNRGLGDQMTRQFAQLYGQNPYGSVDPAVAVAPTRPPVDYFGGINPQSIAKPAYDMDMAGLLERNRAAMAETRRRFEAREI
jgi:hypothetical protein